MNLWLKPPDGPIVGSLITRGSAVSKNDPMIPKVNFEKYIWKKNVLVPIDMLDELSRELSRLSSPAVSPIQNKLKSVEKYVIQLCVEL